MNANEDRHVCEEPKRVASGYAIQLGDKTYHVYGVVNCNGWLEWWWHGGGYIDSGVAAPGTFGEIS